MAHVALLVQDAQGLLAAALVQLVADGLARDGLVLADVGERAELLGLRGSGVDRDHRYPGLLGALDDGLHGVGLGEGDDQAVDLLVDVRLDQLGLFLALLVMGVEELDVVLDGGLLGAVLDDVPEGVAVAGVGDHGEGHPRGVDRRVPRGRLCGPLLGPQPAGAAASRQGRAQQCRQHGGGQRACPCPNSGHEEASSLLSRFMSAAGSDMIGPGRRQVSVTGRDRGGGGPGARGSRTPSCPVSCRRPGAT